MRGIIFIHRLSFVVTALFAGTAWAGPPLPPSVAAAQLDYQQTVRQQQLSTQLQQNQLQEQLREQQQSRLRSVNAGNPATQSQIDHLGAAQHDLYQEQQRSLIQNYNNQVPATLPASRRAVIAPMVNGRIGGP